VAVRRGKRAVPCVLVAIVALIEDDIRIREAVARTLTERGHAVRSSSTGMAGLQEVVDDRPDVVILDLGLPDIDGRELLKMLRAVSTVPVIVATARDDDEDIVRTLDAGADDYIIKPFSADQLEARIRAVLRRSAAGTRGEAGDDGAVIRVGGLAVDQKKHEAFLDGVRLDLTPKEFELLFVLAANADHVVTKRQLLADVWQQPYGGADKTVDVHLSWLRKKLGESAAQPRYLRSIRGVGIKLSAPGG